MQNPEEPNAEQEPNAEHHVAKILVEVLILRSICGPLKRKLMAFSCHIQLSRVPPRCVMLWRSPEMNFTRRPRVAKLLCIGSPLNRSRDITYCTWGNGKSSNLHFVCFLLLPVHLQSTLLSSIGTYSTGLNISIANGYPMSVLLHSLILLAVYK